MGRSAVCVALGSVGLASALVSTRAPPIFLRRGGRGAAKARAAVATELEVDGASGYGIGGQIVERSNNIILARRSPLGDGMNNNNNDKRSSLTLLREVDEEEEDDIFEWESPRSVCSRFSFSEQRTQSSTDWIHNLRTWPSSHVLRRIRAQLLALVGWATLVAAWGFARAARGGPLDPRQKIFGTGMHTLVGGALSLLLVFRTNTAYNRYCEGQRIFDKLSSVARDLADVVGVYRCEVGERRTNRIAALLQAFPMALQLHLQGFSAATAAATPTTAGDPTKKKHRGARGEEAQVLRLFAALGGARDGSGEVPHAAFMDQLRRRPDLAACLGVPTDLDPAQAIQQLYWLKFGGATRDDDSRIGAKRRRRPKKGVTLAELEAYYAPLALMRRLDRTGDTTRAAVTRCSSMPLAIASMLSREAKAVPYTTTDFTSRERLWLLARIATLRSTISAAERLAQTPVPLHYARHTSRFLFVWCFTLPLCLEPIMPSALLPPVIGLIGWALLGLREIGLLIENPFRRSLELTMVTDTLALEISEIFHLHKDTAPPCDETLSM